MNGPWHLVRDDTYTVCGKSPARLRLQMVIMLGPLNLYKMCSNCERMAEADTVRLAKP
jgi:hypothetical protein